jgi:hypothetical protein
MSRESVEHVPIEMAVHHMAAAEVVVVVSSLSSSVVSGPPRHRCWLGECWGHFLELRGSGVRWKALVEQ